MLTLGFIILTCVFIFLEWFVFSPLLPFVTLYYGVFIGSFSVYDIHGKFYKRLLLCTSLIITTSTRSSLITFLVLYNDCDL